MWFLVYGMQNLNREYHELIPLQLPHSSRASLASEQSLKLHHLHLMCGCWHEVEECWFLLLYQKPLFHSEQSTHPSTHSCIWRIQQLPKAYSLCDIVYETHGKCRRKSFVILLKILLQLYNKISNRVVLFVLIQDIVVIFLFYHVPNQFRNNMLRVCYTYTTVL